MTASEVPAYEIAEVGTLILATVINEMIAVRTSAYERWNGPKSPDDQRKEADSWLQKIPGRNKPAILVARSGSDLVGYLWGFENTPGDFYISHIGVRQDCKRHGIGLALVKSCEELARKRGCGVVSTSTFNRFAGMLTLLIGEGFQIVGTTKPAGKTDVRIEFEKRLGTGAVAR